MKLSIDIETYSSVDLQKCGVYKYVGADDFQVLMIAYALNDGPIQIIDLTSTHAESIRAGLMYDFYKYYFDDSIEKWAHNAAFERTCLNKFLTQEVPIEQWNCTMAKVSMLGLPLSLEAASRTMGLEERKSAVGKALIKYFSVPCKPSIVNKGRTRNLPEHAPEKWEQFKEYCKQDVVVERTIRNKIEFFEITETERKLWCLDQKINDNGVLVDQSFVNNAMFINKTNMDKLTTEAVELTELGNPNSVKQLKAWLSEEIDEDVTSLTKDAIPELLKNTDSKKVTRVLNIRQEMAKTSIKKYQAMVNGMGSDNRMRGLLQYYGANRTGRWAGRFVQVQNLPKNILKDLGLARNLVAEKEDIDYIHMLYGNVPNVLSQLIRTAFIAPKDSTFIVADFTSIEARVLAWLAKEQWKLDVFNGDGKIYEATASQMFNTPLSKVDDPLRSKGKVAELALGYQGGPRALVKSGALKMGLTEEELPKIVKLWRNASPNTVRFWYNVGNVAINTVIEGTTASISQNIRFSKGKNTMFIELPSSRKLSYVRPQIKINNFGSEALTYEGMNQTTKKWGQQDTYGGKLVENITQAIARDCLAEAMLKLDTHGFKIVMHIHDEVVIEVSKSKAKEALKKINSIMSESIPWATGLPLGAKSYITDYYKKD